MSRDRRLWRTAACLQVVVAGVMVSTGEHAEAARPGQPPLTVAQAHELSSNVTEKVIVVFKNQLPGLPDTRVMHATRDAAVTSIQSPVLGELSVTRAQHVKRYQLFNSLAATVSPGEARRLAANPAVAEVVPDELIAAPAQRMQRAASRAAEAGSTGTAPPAGVCAPPGQVQLNPQAVSEIHAATQDGSEPSAQALGYTGAGVTVAFIAGSIDINNPDLIRPDGERVFVDQQDFSNTGTNAEGDAAESFGDAASIAAQGSHVYDVNGWGYTTFNRPCQIRVRGVAPGARLVDLDVLGSKVWAASTMLEAVDYAVDVDHVNVLNESLGFGPFPSQASLDLMKMANDAATAAGVTVIAASGDWGNANTIDSPGADSDVITVGGTTSFRAYAQTGVSGFQYPGVTGWADNNISALSSSGFAEDGSTIDLVAPAEANWTLCTPDPRRFPDCTDDHGRPSPVFTFEGTSEAAPLTAGVAALVMQSYAESHGSALPSPAVVKQIITSTAEDIGAPTEQQGAGMLDAYQAVVAARSFPGERSGASGSALLTSAGPLHASASPASTVVLADTVSNIGARPLSVSLSSRTLGAYRSVADTSVRLPGNVRSPVFAGAAEVHFTVPTGAARLDGSITWPGTGPFGFNYWYTGAELDLIDPDGRLSDDSTLFGAGNFGDAQVTDPIPGPWTALIYGWVPPSQGGPSGSVRFGARIADWIPFGRLSASSLTLAPGASRAITLTVPAPAQPGDRAGSIVLTGGGDEPAFAVRTTVSVTLRALVPTPAPTTRFTGTLTGGDGFLDPTEAAHYQISIPAGLRALNAQVTMKSSGNPFLAELVDPATGEASSIASNSLYRAGTGGGTVAIPDDGIQLHVLRPDAGLWTLVIDYYAQVSGTALAQQYTVTLSADLPAFSAPRLPNSPNVRLETGKTVTVDVRVTNTGRVPEEYFVDGRLDQSAVYNLAALTGASVPVPTPFTRTQPEYFVPTHTTSITARAVTPAPVFFDCFWYFGDPDFGSNAPLSRSTNGTFNAAAVAAGAWGIALMQSGPDGAMALRPVIAHTAMTATTMAFDPALNSPTGDLWLQSIDPSSVIDPRIVAPGESVSIPVSITPAGPPGTRVQGTLFVDDTTLAAGDYDWPVGYIPLAPEASDVAAFPYEYTVT